jgi:hypothetical protein
MTFAGSLQLLRKLSLVYLDGVKRQKVAQFAG